MPINYMTPLDTLRNLPGTGFTSQLNRRVSGMGGDIPDSLAGENEFQTPNDAQLMSLQKQRLHEQETQPRFQDRPDIAGLRQSLTKDIAENPLTQQGADVGSYLERAGKASEQGFSGSNPVREQAVYEQQQAKDKLNMPLEVARVNAAGDLAKQQEFSRGAKEVQDSKGQQVSDFYDMVNRARVSGDSNIQGFTGPNGSGSIRYAVKPKPVPVPTPLVRDLTAAQQNLSAPGITATAPATLNPFTWFGKGTPSTQKVAYDQALQAVFAKHPADREIKDMAMEVIGNPRFKEMSIDQIIQDPEIRQKWILDDTNPDELNQLDELLRYGRGQELGQ